MNKKVIGTCGCFDYELHAGHLMLLAYARWLSDEVIVFLVSDDLVRELKGREPYYKAAKRAQNLYEAGVDKVIFLEGKEDEKQILSYPLTDYLLGPDQNSEFDQALRRSLAEKNVRVTRAPVPKDYSTSEMLNHIEVRE